MNIFKIIREGIIHSVGELTSEGFLPTDLIIESITAEPPRDSSHGDVATNAAMVLAKPARKSPREIAEKLVEKIKLLPNVESVEIAGPGFINIRLEDKILYDIIDVALREGGSFGNSDIGKNHKINIEYVSANPTGPLHIGHARGAIVGDVLSLLLLKAGYNVTKEYYINDAGGQVDILAKSAYHRYKEALGVDMGEVPEGLYPGDYLIDIGQSFAQTHEKDYLDVSKDVWLPVIKEFTIQSIMALIRNDLLRIGIEHDVFTSEKKFVESGKIEETIKLLEEKGLLYIGKLDPPKGKLPDDWEERDQLLFKATGFGDDVDRALKKSDGSGTYFASDIAYHNDKIQRGFNEMIAVLGADHGGYVKRLRAAVRALSNNKARMDVLLYQLVNFMEDGKPLKMSKRSGAYITVSDVVDAVGKDVLRFIMLTRKSDATLDFDLKKVTEQSKDNPVFYVQYAHARICSVIRNACTEMTEIRNIDFEDIDKKYFNLIKSKNELDMVKVISQWPRIVESAALHREPHRIAFYLQELASSFHSLWNDGKEDEKLRFIVDGNLDLTIARLALIKSCSNTIASGLIVMGVEPVLEM